MTTGLQVSKEEMLKFVARRSAMKSSDKAYVDVLLPNHGREIFNILGPGVSENPSDVNLKPAISGVPDFNLAYVRNKPGERGALHAHDTTEVFIPMSGRWQIIWGDEEEHSLELEEGDVIAIPPGVFRCFKNIGTTEQWMLAILAGEKHGRLVWPKKVLDQVRDIGPTVGIGFDSAGNIFRLEKTESEIGGK